MALPIWWTWVWASSRSQWWTERPGVLQSMGSQSDMTEQLTPECNILCFEALFLGNYFLSVVALLYFFLVCDELFLYWSIWSRELVVQSLSHVQLFATTWTAAFQASPSLAVSQSLLQLMSMESVMPSDHLIFSHSLHLLPSIFPSITIFHMELGKTDFTSHGKYWSFSFGTSPSNEYSEQIFFTMDWLDLLAAQGTLKSFLQHHNSKASILSCLIFFIIRLSVSRSLYYLDGNITATTSTFTKH